MRRHLLVLAALGVLIGLLFASAASATTFCVGSGPAGCTTEASLEIAIDAANTHSGRDTITLAGGTYSTTAATETVQNTDIVGATQASTIIHRTDHPSGTVDTLDLNNSSLSQATVKSPDGTASGAVSLSGSGASLSDVQVTDGASSLNDLTLVTAVHDAAITNTTLSGKGSDDCFADTVGSAAIITIDRSNFMGCGNGVDMLGDSVVTVAHSTFSTLSNVVNATDGTVNVDEDLAYGVSGRGFQATGPGPTSNPKIVVTQSTIVGAGGGADRGINLTDANGTSSSVSMYDSILVGFAIPALRSALSTSHPGYLALDHVAFQGTDSDVQCGGPSNSNGSCTDFAPVDTTAATAGFVNPATNFHLTAASPLINLDATPEQLGVSATDLDGHPRVVDAARDLGAYEIQPPPAPSAKATAAPLITGSLKFSPKKVKHGKKGKVTYVLSAPATVTFTAKGKKTKKNKKPKTIKLGSQVGRAGSNSFMFKTSKLKKGKYTFSATPAGGTAKTASLTVK